MVPFRKIFGPFGIVLRGFDTLEKIDTTLECSRDQFVNGSLQSRIRLLESILPQQFQIHQKKHCDLDCPIFCEGYCDIGDFREVVIHVVVLYRSDKELLGEEDWVNFKIAFQQTICHELIHLAQSKRTRNIRKMMSHPGYLDDPIEIDAYAHCAFLESWLRSGCNDPVHNWKGSDSCVKQWYADEPECVRRRFVSKFFKWGNRWSQFVDT